MSEKDNPNQHIIEYLDWYLSDKCKNCQFAVMIKGGWGSGKTYFLKQQYLENDPEKFIYISLNGLSKCEDIDDLLFQQLHPFLASKGMAVAGKVAKGLLKFGLKVDLDDDTSVSANSSVPDVKLQEYLTKFKDKHLVFDDLERCDIQLGKVLGYISNFVEHQEKKVIILSNEGEIDRYIEGEEASKKDQKQHYSLIKEKLIGKTFEICSDIPKVINSILKKSCNHANTFVSEREDDCIIVFKAVENELQLKNYRSFAHALRDFDYLYKHLDNKYKTKTDLMNDFFKLFVALSYELQLGTFKEEWFTEQEPNIMTSMFSAEEKSEKKDYIEEFFNHHSSLIKRLIISPVLWRNILCDSKFSLNELEQEFNQSSYFPATREEWRILWDMWNSTNDEFESALESTLERFESKDYSIPEVVMQVYGIFLNLHKEGEEKISTKWPNTEDLKIAFKAYIDSMEVNEDIKHFARFSSSHFPSRYGLSFYSKDTDDFKEIYEYCQETLNFKNEESIFRDIEEFLNAMVENSTTFNMQLTKLEFDGERLWNVRVFNRIDSAQFFSKWQEIPRGMDRHMVANIFEERYNRFDPAYGDMSFLCDEKGFLEELLRLVNGELERLTGFNPYIISLKDLKKSLESGINHIENLRG